MKVTIESLEGKAKIYLVDPKRVEFSRYSNVAESIIYNKDDLEVFLWGSDIERGMIETMEARYILLEHHGVSSLQEYNAIKGTRKMQPMVIIIDEFESVSHGDNIMK